VGIREFLNKLLQFKFSTNISLIKEVTDIFKRLIYIKRSQRTVARTIDAGM